jgi:peptide deformylase
MPEASSIPAWPYDDLPAARIREKPPQLRVFPDAVLRQQALPVTRFDHDLRRVATDMLNLMRACGGVGVAAPQVGLLLRLIVFDTGYDPLCLVNPELFRANGLERMEEGCLSLPGVVVDVDRATSIIVRGWNVDGRSLRLGLSGLLARVVQHEIDHLDGMLILDRGEKIVRAPVRKEKS